MRLDRFDLNLLVAFHTLMEERSVTRAAEQLAAAFRQEIGGGSSNHCRIC